MGKNAGRINWGRVNEDLRRKKKRGGGGTWAAIQDVERYLTGQILEGLVGLLVAASGYSSSSYLDTRNTRE